MTKKTKITLKTEVANDEQDPPWDEVERLVWPVLTRVRYEDNVVVVERLAKWLIQEIKNLKSP